MSKKKKKEIKETNIENYYDLRTDAVDDLVEALKTGQSKEDVPTNITEITGEQTKAKPGSKKAEFDPYRRDKLAALPTWLKAIFIKWWFAGCVCYFVMMGLGSLLGAPSPATNENLFLLTAVIFGVVVDVFVNPTFRYLESDRKEYNAYMMFPFPFKKFWTFFANIIYYFLVMVLVNFSINLINLIVHSAGGDRNIYLEPLLFGTLVTIIDMAFIGLKDLIVYLVKRAKHKNAPVTDEYAQIEGVQEAVKPAKAKGKKGKKLQNAQPVQPQPVAEVDEETDEVEKLKRLAEQKNAQEYGEGNSSKPKSNKKKK